MSIFKTVLLLSVVAVTAYAQGLECTADAAVVPTARSEGEAEPVGDVFLVCSGGTPAASTAINITLTLNTNITGLALGADSAKSEALLLIDDPSPDAVNLSNGFSYNGEVLGTPYVAAGAPGSGNVYLADQTSATSVTWYGVPFVAPGPSASRTLRLTDIRANATMLASTGGLTPVMASLTSVIPIGNPSQILVALGYPGLAFAATLPQPGTANLTFTENFAGAFRERVLPGTGPFTAVRQDIPGELYNTESQLTPCFTYGDCTTPPAAGIGLATNGTMLLARMTNLGTAAASVSVPNQVVSAVGQLTAYLIVDGKPVEAAGSTSLAVTGASLNVLYEVTGSDAFSIDNFTIPAVLFNSSGASIAYPASAMFNGYLAPIDSTPTASATAPRPRFAP
jgi:hypothetical protein